jgi:ATP-dependent Clp protease ATP-binding subunit ClpA/ATP-dependent Clp protease ATP-binding subunit ClpC
VQLTIPLFERRTGGVFSCTTVALGPYSQREDGKNLHKVHTKITDRLRPMVAKANAWDLRRLQMPRGIRLERVRLELTLTGAGERRKVTGVYPIVIEPRWASATERLHLAYHPLRQGEAIVIRPDLPLDEQLRPHLSRAWAELDDHELEGLTSRGRERLDLISFSVTTRTLLDDLPAKARDDADSAPKKRRGGGLRVLPRLGVNLSDAAARGDLDVGVPRSPYRERLQLLLGAGKSRPVVVVGPPGCGKSTLIHRAALDLLEIDGYPGHKNLDRVWPVFRLSGRRIIAGMSRLGEWEQRCVEILEDCRARDVILVIEDLDRFGSIGRSRESDRSLADFFRGPLARREIVMIGECTEEAWRRLEQDAPTFASLFSPIHVAPTTAAETLRLLVREMRDLEGRFSVEISPHALRAILDLSGSLLSSRAFPGKAVDLLRELARAHHMPGRPNADDYHVATTFHVSAREVLALLSQKTGVPEILLRGDAVLAPGTVEAALGAQVMGQDEAVKVAADVVYRVKAGLVDPRRPYGVFLFTGPTGTGKTELAKCLAEYLYGSASRMLRFDMSELSGPDAPSRLIGHRWKPEGLLTQRVLEQPFSLVLLDEIEKAHPSVLSLLLQLFEDGRLTDAGGRTAHFQHTVVIMTSNLGARPRPAVGFGESAEAVLHDVARAVREFFPPELFNRIDRIVPFRPLTPEIAERVAEKELRRLCQRRGLTERSIFVDVGPGVAARAAREAFVARDGARSVKRFLEDRIGSPLAAAITEGEAAAMQILRLTVEGDGFRVDRRALVEASPAEVRWAIEPLLRLSLPQIQEKLPELLAFVEELETGDQLARLSDRIRFHLAQQGVREHAEAVYNLDDMRATIHAFRERIEELRRASGEDDHELLELEQFPTVIVPLQDLPPQRFRLFIRSQMPERARIPSKGEVIATLAEGYWLRRALRLADDPTQHAVFLDVSRVADLGEGGRFDAAKPGLLAWLSTAYCAVRGEQEDSAVLRADGTLLPQGHAWVTAARVVLKIVGLGVRDFFELEDGLHVWTSLGRGPEVVRVRVYPAEPGETAAAAVDRPVPSAALAKVVRKIRFDPPIPGGPAVPVEIEDYVMGFAETVHARTLADALAPIWLLRGTREEVAR